MTRRKKTTAEDLGLEVETVQEKAKKTTNKEEQVSLFTLAVVAIVILAIVGVVFGYFRDQLSEIKKEGKENVALNSQLEILKKEISDLTSKAQKLELENIMNKEIVLNLFDKNRELPDEVNFEGWSVYKNEEAGVQLNIPSDWEVQSANKIINSVEKMPALSNEQKKEQPVSPSEKTLISEDAVPQYQLMLQPKNVAEMIKAITLKDDYVDLWKLSLEEKQDVFAKINFIDQQEFDLGVLLYFIDIDDKDNQIPTVLILTDDRIMRATFNILDRNVSNYVKYRLDFEALVTGIEFLPVAEKTE